MAEMEHCPDINPGQRKAQISIQAQPRSSPVWPGVRYQHGPAQAKLSFMRNLELPLCEAKSSGPRMAPSSLLLSLPLFVEVLPVGIIAGATIGAGILVIFFFVALVFFLYRRRKGSEYRHCAAITNASSPTLPFRVTSRGGGWKPML